MLILIPEIYFRFVLWRNPNISILRNKYEDNRGQLSEKESEYFCDDMHKTKIGNVEVAKVVTHEIKKFKLINGYKKVLIFGGSTTEGFDCESETSWPIEFKKLNPMVEVINYASNGKNFSFSYPLLKNQIKLKKDVAPVIIWAHSFNEMSLYGGSLDENYQMILNKNQFIRDQLGKDLKAIGFLRFHFSIFLYRVYKSLLYKSLSFRFLSNTIGLLIRSNFRGLYSLDIIEPNRGVDNFQKGENLSIVNNFRFIFTDVHIQYALENLRINHEKLLQFSKENDVKLVFVNLPFVRNYFRKLLPHVGSKITEGFQLIQDEIESFSKKKDVFYIDVDDYFQKSLFNSVTY